jgi:N-acetylated-alpha-linked acidic dipeptidase
MRFADLAATVTSAVGQVEALARAERSARQRTRRLLADGSFRLAADPAAHLAPPLKPSEFPNVDFAALRAAAEVIEASAATYDAAFARAAADGFALPARNLLVVNQLLQGLEGSLLAEEGLPGRPWYRHMLYAPGLDTGYGAKTLPGIREALERGDGPTASAYIAISARVLQAAARRLDAAAIQLEYRKGPEK